MMANSLELAPFRRRSPLYNDLSPSLPGRRMAPNMGALGGTSPMFNRHEPFLPGPASHPARMSGMNGIGNIDSRLSSPIRHMPLPNRGPYYDDYDYDARDGIGGGIVQLGGYGKPRAMSHPFVHLPYDPLYQSLLHQASCGCGNHGNSNGGERSGKGDGKGGGGINECMFKTKDIAVRGKIYSIRASYLSEAPKFENELVKYFDKKKEDVVPTRVLKLLVDYINKERYDNQNVVEEVILHVVCSTIGCKSAAEYALGRLKDWTKDGGDLEPKEVDDKIKDWLKTYMKGTERVNMLERSRPWRNLMHDRPEVGSRLAVLLGMKKKEEDGDYRIL